MQVHISGELRVTDARTDVPEEIECHGRADPTRDSACDVP